MCVVVLLNLDALLDLCNIVTIGIILDHTSHAELRNATANGLFHRLRPEMGHAICSTIEIAWYNLLFQKLVQRKTIGLILCVLIVVFACFSNRPSIGFVISFRPPAV